MIGYVLPSVLYLAAYEEERRAAWSTAKDTLLSGAGDQSPVSVGVRGSYVAIRLGRAYRAGVALSNFFLPVAMVVFGFISLLIGVTTVAINAS
jgi:hypothetical protein